MKNKQLKKMVKIISLNALILALVAGCAAKADSDPESAANEAGIKTVKTAVIEKAQIADPLEQVGEVLSSSQVDIVVKAAGAEVLEIVKQRGEKAAKGEVIVKLDRTDMNLQREKALLSVESARNALEIGRAELNHAINQLEQALADAAKNLNKAKNDYDWGHITQAQLDQAENAYNNVARELELVRQRSVTPLELQLQSSQLMLEEVDRQLSFYDITAPIEGVITELMVQEGMTLSAGMPIGKIQQLDPVKIKTLLTPEFAQKVRGKKELNFYIPGEGQLRTGEVTYLADVMDTLTSTYELNLEAPNADQALKPGMNVQVLLTEESDEIVVVVPTTSIVREGVETYVFVYADGIAERRKVELGRLNDTMQEVISGVEEGELLIVSGQHQLHDQEPVQLSAD